MSRTTNWDTRPEDGLSEHVHRRRDGQIMRLFSDPEGYLVGVWLGGADHQGDAKYLDPAWAIDVQGGTGRAYIVPAGQHAPSPLSAAVNLEETTP